MHFLLFQIPVKIRSHMTKCISRYRPQGYQLRGAVMIRMGQKSKSHLQIYFFLIVTRLIQMLLFVCFFIYVSIYQLGERKQPSQSFVWSKKKFHHNKKQFPSEVIMNACACTATGLMRMQCCKLPSPFCGRRVYKNNISLLLSLQILKNPRP